MRYQTRVVNALLVIALTAGCSTANVKPSEFDDMAADEIGCTLLYESDPEYVVGPLGPSNFGVIEPTDDTKFRIGRTALDITIWARFDDGSGLDASIPLESIPEEGDGFGGPTTDPDKLGWTITCWRGES